MVIDVFSQEHVEEPEIKEEFDPDSCIYGITDHCMDRYIERIKGKVVATSDEKDKFKIEIKKLFMSSTKYYEGIIGKNTNPVAVYCNRNGWIFIVDEKTTSLVTLYKVDLNVDDDMINQMYIDKALEKIAALKNKYDEEVTMVEATKLKYLQEICDYEDSIKEYKKLMKQMEDQISNLRGMINNEHIKVDVANANLRNALTDFMIKDKDKIEK